MLSLIRKRMLVNPIRQLHVDQEGLVGKNFPFQTKNKARMIITVCATMGFFFNIPVMTVYYYLNKKSG